MNLKEIAALAGVSPAAVSRFFNDGSLSADKQERIRKVIEETNFSPNRLARDLRKGHVPQVGVIVPKIHSISVSEVLSGINEILSQKHYLTLLGCTDESDEREEEYLSRMEAYRLAGLIVMATSVTPEKEKRYREINMPVVITGQYYPSLDCIFHDDYHAMAMLTERMVRAGRTHFAYIGVSDKDPAVGLNRKLGALDTLKNHDIKTDKVPVRIAEFTMESGYRCMQDILEGGYQPDGVLCATATIAHGAMLALREAGIRVPDKASIAGIGNNEANRISSPALTSVRLYQNECGREAARMLLRRIEEKSEDRLPSRHTMLGYTFVNRNSI
ncbi:MAG: LacI family DNA-binding transcriptional regulator [Firmicutes bacterium]|nr:LacI family DNA-binding transcriptional regulator [Bacillota bacterium]